jgi:hypothetical protein
MNYGKCFPFHKIFYFIERTDHREVLGGKGGNEQERKYRIRGRERGGGEDFWQVAQAARPG